MPEGTAIGQTGFKSQLAQEMHNLGQGSCPLLLSQPQFPYLPSRGSSYCLIRVGERNSNNMCTVPWYLVDAQLAVIVVLLLLDWNPRNLSVLTCLGQPPAQRCSRASRSEDISL